MATREQTYKASILINSEQAVNNIQKLEKQIEELKARGRKAFAEGRLDVWKAANKEADSLLKKLEKQQKLAKGFSETINNLRTAKPKELRDLINQINKELNSPLIRKGSEEWKAYVAVLKDAKKQLKDFNDLTAEHQSVGKRFFKFLNDSWGGLTVLLSSITGISMTIRKTVSDYAAMQEELADVRKYTGLTAEEVDKLNEKLKQMDTRTSREELNRLAGAAGRLGITSQEAILEFVDAADKIKVALGDDLGEGAVDQIGKLAMAFGEDDRLGLRGAMLATGSALNELAQNSAAKAGYLVEFTARVAGVGKQLGLTQAQIMGFATVMDEALLKDEMAATAFSQMITKMATNAEKFASFAGMEASKFADLVRTDINGAIMALADNLKMQDATTMLKMFSDMGLDGQRAVGVLANMADKIDDVRKHQETATEAYEEGSSVLKEFGVMNNTVQARLDKCKKSFHEMAIELGEKLQPVVRYTISATGLLVKGLSALTSFVLENKTAILAATVGITAYTAVVNAATIAKKADLIVTKALTIATQLWNNALKLNPIGLIVAGLTMATALFIKYRDRINGAREATNMLRIAGTKLMEVMAQVTGWMTRLVKLLVQVYDKFSFVRKGVQLLTTAFTAGFSTITNIVKLLVDELGGVANIIEGMFTLDWAKIKDGYKKGFKAIADAAVAQFNIVKNGVKGVFSAPPPANGAKTVAAGEEAGSNVMREVVVQGNRKKKTGGSYKTTEEIKKEAEEHKRILKERVQEARAEYEAELAEEMLAYRQGITTYSDYMKERHNITQNYYDEMKRIYGEDAAEYRKLLQRRESDESEFLQWQRKQGEDELIREKLEKEMALRRSFYDEQNKEAYQNQDVLNEALFQLDIEYQQKRKTLYNEGSKEWMEQDALIRQKELQHQWDLEQDWMKRLAQYREEMGRTDIQKRQQMEEEGVKAVYGTLVEQGRMTEEEYDAIIEHIRMKYAQLKAETSASQSVKAKAGKSLETAEKAAGTSAPYAGNDAATGVSSVMAAVERQRLINERLKELYGEDYENNAEYQEAKRQLDSQTMQSIVAGAEAAYSTISTMLSAASSFAQACSDLEVARITKNYDRQIEAAGKNSKKREKLEKEKEESIAKAKTKANKKAMVMELAQALAQTAMGAISAYSSTMAGAPYPANLILAPISAGIATAAGMLQVATIKKQHQAEAAGYYEGGFTSGKNYRREAGVVHEGEFVANHQAVNNAQLSPIFNLIDRAQRNNRVAQLKAEDVSRVIGSPAAAVVTPVVNVQTDNSELQSVMSETRDTVDRLNEQLEKGIRARVSIDGEDGVKRNLDRYNNMMSKK